jgi:hypothetical protein
MQLPERAVQLQLLLGQQCQLCIVTAPLGYCDQFAQLTLAADDGSLVNLLDGALDLGLFGRLGLGQPFKYP